MRKAFPSFLLVLLILLAMAVPARAGAASAGQPVVRAAMFWMDGCPFCKVVMTDFLPGLQAQYGSQLELTLIELATVEKVDQFYALGAAYGLMKTQLNTPLVLIGSHILIGADQISNQMPSLVTEYLAAGGVDFPASPMLAEMLPAGQLFTQFDLSRLGVETVEAKSSGMTIAWIVMSGMVAALLLVGFFAARAFNGRPLALPAWVDWSIPIVAIAGLGVAIYLTYVETTSAVAICGPIGDCNSVQQSEYSKLFGFLPVGLLGAFGYVAILIAWLYRRLRRDALARLAGPAIFGMALFGTLFSIYLTYLEIFVIKAVCMWCIASAVAITLLMLAGLPPLTRWLAVSDEEA